MVISHPVPVVTTGETPPFAGLPSGTITSVTGGATVAGV